MTGNKGEWSEPYVLIKLLADGKLAQGEKDLTLADEDAYAVVAVSRVEKVGKDIVRKLYERRLDTVSIFANNMFVGDLPVSKFEEEVDVFFKEISSLKGTSALSDEITTFLENVNIESVKADSSKKADVDVVIHDHFSATDQNLGFSVKSQLGSPSSLINASKDNTNFRYKISGILTNLQIAEINAVHSRSKVKDRISLLREFGVQLVFDSVIGDVYRDNLLLLDRDLADILACCLMSHYSGESSDIEEIVKSLDAKNPQDFPVGGVSYYAFKLKRYLSESALGMMTAKPWSGVHHATGGYIIVKDDGELVSYHLLRKNMFEDYLLYNTKFETPSTSRHKFGEVYTECDELYMNLNLQIRFKK